MTHQEQSTAFDEVIQLLTEEGFDGMAQAITVLLNEAMKLERSEALGAAPYERANSRRGYANGFKPKTVSSRLGTLRLNIPQTRNLEFYPSALERGERSERALKLAVAGTTDSRSASTPKTTSATSLAAAMCPVRALSAVTAEKPTSPSSRRRLKASSSVPSPLWVPLP